MNQIRRLVKKRDVSFLFPQNISKSGSEDIDYAMKAIGYFRNYPLFKVFYNLINKSFFMSIDQLKKSYEEIERIKDMSTASKMQVEGFLMCVEKSKKDGVIKVVNTFIRPFISFGKKKENALIKSIRDYYDNGKEINIALINKGKVSKINTYNVVRSVYRMK